MLRAYLLALFSHMVTKLLGDLHLKLFGPEALLALFEHKKNDEVALLLDKSDNAEYLGAAVSTAL